MESVSVILTELPLSVATRLSVWLALTAPASTENWALVDPAAAVTELGKVTEPGFVAWMVIFKPPAGATADRVMWQVEDVCAGSTVGLHTNPVRVTAVGGGGTSVSEKF